jgi:Protein of unknown function (DUF3626)
VSWSQAVQVVADRAERGRVEAMQRWRQVIGSASANDLNAVAAALGQVGRVTVNFHPDRRSRSGTTVAAGLLRDGRYHSQWRTGISNGSRSAVPGGDRHRYERDLFGAAYDDSDPIRDELPVYGAFDLLCDQFGGSPRFGSCYLVLRPAVLARTTICVGDSHAAPRDVGTVAGPWCLLAALAEQAATDALFDRRLGVEDLLRVLDGTVFTTAPGRCLDGYLEAQVHGGVELGNDVAAMVFDPCFRGTPVGDDLVAAAERFGLALHWHEGSELTVDDVPSDFRGPTMPGLAKRITGPDSVLTARHIGAAVDQVPFGKPDIAGDPPESDLQQLKYVWHTLLACGRPALRP